MSTKNERVYRQATSADLPLIQEGSLKAFYVLNGVRAVPAKLLSTRFRSVGIASKAGWLASFEDYDVVVYGLQYIVVDVSPEKRYAIWDHKNQRFVERAKRLTVGCAGFVNNTDVEIELDSLNKNQPGNKFYIVEWEIKGNE